MRRFKACRPTHIQILHLVLLIIIWQLPAWAADFGRPQENQGSYAIGLGLEYIQGDYGVNAGARLLTMPLLIQANPTERFDLALELPLVIASSKTGSTMLVTQGGGGRRWSGTSTTTTVTTNSTVTEVGLGDINLTAGWVMLDETDLLPELRPTLYLKLPTGNDRLGLGTGTVEAGPGLSLSKWLGDLHIFGDGNYIFQDDTELYAGKNYVSYSGGIGYQLNERVYTSIYAKGSTTRVEDGHAPLEGRIKLGITQSRKVSWDLYVIKGFTDASPDVGAGAQVMYQF